MNVYKHNNFYIIPNSTFNPIFEPPFACQNTTTSSCSMGPRLDQCMNICQNNVYCDYGYHIGSSNPRRPQVCMLYSQEPLNDIYKFQPYNIISADNVKILKDNNISAAVFYKQNAWELDFDNKVDDIVFFGDTFVIKNVATGLYLKLEPIITDADIARFENKLTTENMSANKLATLQLFERPGILSKPLTFNDYFTLSMPNTNLTLYGKLDWQQTEEPLNPGAPKIVATPADNTLDSNIKYGQKIYLQLFDGSYLKVENNLLVSNKIKVELNPQFLFIFENISQTNKNIFHLSN